MQLGQKTQGSGIGGLSQTGGGLQLGAGAGGLGGGIQLSGQTQQQVGGLSGGTIQLRQNSGGGLQLGQNTGLQLGESRSGDLRLCVVERIFLPSVSCW